MALPGAGATNAERAALFEIRVWLERREAAAPGSFFAFLSDGTLIMASCGEPYRLAPWRWVDEGTVVWEEDGTNLRADVAIVERREMALILDPEGLNESRGFEAAQSPVVCPDQRS